MAHTRKYWIRYNKGADRLEQEITEGRFRPQGFGWKEISIDQCCFIPEAIGNTIEVPYDSLLVNDCSELQSGITITFMKGINSYSFDITPDTENHINLPEGLTGNFTIFIHAEGNDYVKVEAFDVDDGSIANGTTDGSGTGVTGSFNIANLDRLVFTCVSSG
jgi:hypothetical protein